MPDAFVATVIVAVLLLNTPEAPEPGAVKVTFTPETGLLPASFTVTANAFGKAELMVADCGVVPAFAVIDVAVPLLTTMPVAEPVREEVTVSMAVILWDPSVRSVAEKTLVPLDSAPSAGNVAVASEEVKCTVPV